MTSAAAAAAEPSPAAPAGTEATLPADRQMHRRVRVAMYLAFVALALFTLIQGGLTLRAERRLVDDTQILEVAGLLRARTQDVARHALPLLAPQQGARERARDRLAQALAGTDAAARELEPLLASLADDPGAAAWRGAGAEWEAARARLAERAQALLARGEPPSPAQWELGVQAFQADAERAADAAWALQSALHAGARARSTQVERAVLLNAGVMLLLLAGLALAVVEPMARAVRRQVGLLERQALQLRRLALVAEHTSAAVVVSDRADRVQWVNGAFTRLTGWNAAEVEGALLGDLLHHPNAPGSTGAAIREAVADGRGLRSELLCRRRDGSELWLDVDLRPVHDAHGAAVGFVSVSTDVGSRLAEQRKLRLLWAALPAGVVVQDAGGAVVDVNLAAERLLGAPRERLIGASCTDPAWHVVHEDMSPIAPDELAPMRTLRSGVALSNETVGLRAPDGVLRWLLVNTEPQRDEQGQVTGVVSCFIDITERRQLQQRLHETARTDALTGLPNRAVVMERVQRGVEHVREHPGYGFALLFMDFDRFKQVNDSLGHGAGDELLRQIAARLRKALRPGDEVGRVVAGDDLAARLGGDEFVVVLEGVRDPETVRAVADRLLAELAEPYTVLDHPVQSSASIGIVLADDGEPTAEELLRNADTAMYEAKRAGRGRWVLFEPSMHDRLVHSLAVEQDLRRALQEDELFVVYQPVVELDSGRLAGVEALVRWQHPERGLVPPGDFIVIAEECGLIDAIGHQVLTKACSQFMRWRAELVEHAPPMLAVNLSRAQLERPQIVRDVLDVLRAAGMPPGALQLEVTESLAAQDERVQSTLRELKAHGVRLALDDFGTGYSSLACLHQLPVDTVKVDRSFVRHAETVEYHRVLIEATIRVARTLGMTTVAEGIETVGQAALMQSLACDRGQGWLYGKAMDGDEIGRWQHERRLARTLA
jgi:diguanylate cyclase (GGDEF)-like protein/PAS domain S-box-containing protein